MALTVGTAGHVDHGKTWLVRALTGKDTDRLPEEKARGISIDLGYAPLELPDGRRLSLVDVPGHERFVRTMVAGATGIDLFLLVIDAGEGARPQTHEHLAILGLLGVERGVVAVTKADAVDADTLELAVEEARELVPDSEVVVVSARTGEGLDALQEALARAADAVPPRTDHAPTRLYVDRAFTLRGIGTVVTGTLWSGTIGDGDQLRLEPSSRAVRVRSVEVHDEAVERAGAGQRVAVSLPGIERSEVARGDALVTAGAYPTSYRLDVVLEDGTTIADGDRISVHHGTSRIPAKAVRSGDRFAQLRLARPVVARRGDRVVLRAETTLGGGTIIDPAPPRHRDSARFELVERGEITATVDAPVHVDALRHMLDGEPEGVLRAGPWLLSETWLEELESRLRADIEASDPLDPGVPLPAEPWADDVLGLLPFTRRGAKLVVEGTTSSLEGRKAEAEALLAEVTAAGMTATRVADPALARVLEEQSMIVRLGDGFAIGADAHEVARDVLIRECATNGDITLARFRDLVGCGRRDAQMLLERFDADGLTRRLGDRRVLRRAGREPTLPAV